MEKVLNMLWILRERPKMVFENGDGLVAYKKFIEGYVHGLGHGLEIDVTSKIVTWLRRKYGPFSLFWTDFLINHYNGKSEDEKKEVLLGALEDFFKENPNWYLVQEEE